MSHLYKFCLGRVFLQPTVSRNAREWSFFRGESGSTRYHADRRDRAAAWLTAGALAGARRTDLVRVFVLADHGVYSLFLFK